MTKIVLLGATGYTGRLAARALVRRGATPLLVGRDLERLQRCAAAIGGAPYAVADATDVAALSRLLAAGDVLVSTAGPFWKLGATQVEAALASGAHYLDSCGEPAFFRTLVQRFAGARKSAVLSACAYDFFPGNYLADHVLEAAGDEAVRVDLGYFGDTAPGYQVSAGSRASGLLTMLEPGLFWREGRLVLEPIGLRLGHVRLDGVARPGVSMAGTEHLFVPPLHPRLREINAYWGWAGAGSRALQRVCRVNGALAQRPALERALNALLGALARSDGSGPDDNMRERSAAYVCAVAFDAAGRPLTAAQLGDADGFSFTADLLAWAADSIAREGVAADGVTGPVQAFGRERLRDGLAQAGFQRKSVRNYE
jgi:short subunit dehydrogenase-like uncharacterized protein